MNKRNEQHLDTLRILAKFPSMQDISVSEDFFKEYVRDVVRVNKEIYFHQRQAPLTVTLENGKTKTVYLRAKQ